MEFGSLLKAVKEPVPKHKINKYRFLNNFYSDIDPDKINLLNTCSERNKYNEMVY